jgi:hypothetical protein
MEIISIKYRPECAFIIVPGAISFFMNRKFPGFIRSHALMDEISIFDAFFLMQKIQGMTQSSMPAHLSILPRVCDVFTEKFNEIYGKHSFSSLVMIYNTAAVSEMGVPKTCDSLRLATWQFSDAQRHTECCLGLLQKIARLWYTLHAKNQITLIVAS